MGNDNQWAPKVSRFTKFWNTMSPETRMGRRKVHELSEPELRRILMQRNRVKEEEQLKARRRQQGQISVRDH